VIKVMMDNVITGFIFRCWVERYGLRVNKVYQICRAKLAEKTCVYYDAIIIQSATLTEAFSVREVFE